MIQDLGTYIVPTTVRDGDDGWFAGIRHGLTTHYWRGNRFETEDAAANYAAARIDHIVGFLIDDFGPMQKLGEEER